MPAFLCGEMQDYLNMLYGIGKKDRIFPFTKSYLYHEMDCGAKVAGVKRIRIHDIRHSPIWIGFANGTGEIVLAHEPTDFLGIYDDSLQ